MNNFFIAQIFGTFGIIFSVLSMQMKDKKNIMIMFIGLNISCALNFFFLGSITGCFINTFGAIETFINYKFDSKNKSIPIYIISIYVIVNLILGFISYKNIIDLLPIINSLIFVTSVCAQKESIIRKIMFVNQSIWLIFDILTKSYTLTICSVLTLISIIISIIRYDIKKNKVR